MSTKTEEKTSDPGLKGVKEGLSIELEKEQVKREGDDFAAPSDLYLLRIRNGRTALVQDYVIKAPNRRKAIEQAHVYCNRFKHTFVFIRSFVKDIEKAIELGIEVEP